MKNLQELVHIVNENKVKQIELLNLRKYRSSKVNTLYRLLSKDEVQTDEEAYNSLYPGNNSKSAYNNLKSSLRDKLINTLFFIDTSKSSYSDRQSAYFEAHKEYAAAQILLAKNAHISATDLLEKLLKRALQYDFSELVWMTARLLRLQYGTRFGDVSKFEVYDELVQQMDSILELENQAEYYYSSLILNFVKNKSPKPLLAEEARDYFIELEPYLEHCRSYKFHFFAALIELFQYTCVNHYTVILPICERYITFFTNKPYSATTPIQLCYHHQLVAYLQLGHFAQAKDVALKSRYLIEEGTFNWFNNLEYLLLLGMHTQRYEDAYKVFLSAVEHKRFKYLPQYVRELWEIYRAYLHLMIDAGQLTSMDNDRNFTPFRLNRFLNSIPIYAKDKRGMNIAVLIVQILFYIQKGKEDECIDRIETIKKYCARHLAEAENIRSYHFIHLLLTIAEAGFRPELIQEKAAPHWHALQQTSISFSQQFHKVEIIPYETLWEMMLKWLAQDKQALRLGS